MNSIRRSILGGIALLFLGASLSGCIVVAHDGGGYHHDHGWGDHRH
jgi:hypothetical protein